MVYIMVYAMRAYVKENWLQRTFTTGDIEDHWVKGVYAVILCVPCGEAMKLPQR
jgi:hypothetical protein